MIPLGPSPEGTYRGSTLSHRTTLIDFVYFGDTRCALAS